MFRLMIKTSNQGLKYLCVTKRDDYEEYKGSGRDWKQHLSIYGDDITTLVLYETESSIELSDVGMFYSNFYDIVDSKEWANVVKEEGYKHFNRFNHWCVYDNSVSDKISEAQTKMFQKMSKDEKAEYTSRWRKGSEIWRENLSQEEYVIYCLKLSEAQKMYYQNMDEDERIKLSEKNRNMRLNMSEESKQSRKEKIQEVYATGKHQHIFDKFSEERQGGNNPCSKKVSIQGVVYGCIKDACDELNITRAILNGRLKSEKYPDYIRI